MKEEEQRIEIAMACGARWYKTKGNDLWLSFKDLEAKYSWCKLYNHSIYPEGCIVFCEDIPNYTTDLNAMQLAWGFLGWKEKNECVEHLKGIVIEAFCEAYFASAEQRAEAFLKTIGKWKEQ